jgi:hypothetical protein
LPAPVPAEPEVAIPACAELASWQETIVVHRRRVIDACRVPRSKECRREKRYVDDLNLRLQRCMKGEAPDPFHEDPPDTQRDRDNDDAPEP